MNGGTKTGVQTASKAELRRPYKKEEEKKKK
jgi:hypothetical protein